MMVLLQNFKEICCLIRGKFKALFDRNFFKCLWRLAVGQFFFNFWWIFDCIRSCFQKAKMLNRFVSEPVRRPYAIEFSARAFQNFLPQAVSVACIFRGEMRCSITLNCKHIIRTIR